MIFETRILIQSLINIDIFRYNFTHTPSLIKAEGGDISVHNIYTFSLYKTMNFGRNKCEDVCGDVTLFKF